MIDIRQSSDLSHTCPDELYLNDDIISAEALRIENPTSTSNISELAPYTRCANCKSQIIVGSLNSGDLLDLNRKRHFCENVDRIKHEEKCVIEIQRYIEYYNRRELSSFQLELNIH